AIRYCLDYANLRLQDVDYLALSRNPRSKLISRLRFALGSRAGRHMAWGRGTNIARLLSVKRQLTDGLEMAARELRAKVALVEHHRAHIASSFFVSPFERAA